MIDSNKLLSKNQVSRGRNIVTIKRNLIKINNLLKERLVLTKIRKGIMMQEEENRIRRQREDDLESLEPTRKIEDDKPKDDKKNSGLLAALATLGLLFLPGLKKLLNFLNDIKDRVGNMAKLFLKAMTDFKDKAFAFLNKVNLANFDKEKIQTSFAKLEKDLKNFVNTLVFAAVTNFAVSTLGKLSGFNIQNLIRRGRKTKVDDVLDDVPVGEGEVPFETGTFRKTPIKVEKPVKVNVGKGSTIGEKTALKALRKKVRQEGAESVLDDVLYPRGKYNTIDGKRINNFLKLLRKSKNSPDFDNTSYQIDLVLKALKKERVELLGTLTKGSKQYNDVLKSIKKFDKALNKIDDIRLDVIEQRATSTAQGKSAQISVDKTINDLFDKYLKDLDKGFIDEKTFRKIDKLLKKPQQSTIDFNKYLGGLATLGQYTLGEQGPEFIIDADSTLAIENTAPGFLNALNKAEGFQSIDVLRNYASYEGAHLQSASFFPVFIPTPSNKKSQIMLAVSGGNGSRQTVFSKIHDKR